MKMFEYIDRISIINKLISERRTGTPDEFAGRLGVGRSSLYEMIDELRSRGAPIEYSRREHTFYYREPFDIRIMCSFRNLTMAEMENFSGGLNFFCSVLFFRTERYEFCQ